MLINFQYVDQTFGILSAPNIGCDYTVPPPRKTHSYAIETILTETHRKWKQTAMGTESLSVVTVIVPTDDGMAIYVNFQMSNCFHFHFTKEGNTPE